MRRGSDGNGLILMNAGRRVFGILAVVLALVATAVVLPPRSSGATSSETPLWTMKSIWWSAGAVPTSPLADPVLAVSCPDLSHCWVSDLQGGIYETSDGGVTWNGQGLVTTGSPSFQSLSCATDMNCVAAATLGDVEWTDDGGSVWSPSPLIASIVSCPSAEVCFATAVDGPIEESTDGGDTWTVPDPNAEADVITCPSQTVCYSNGNRGFDRTNDGGVTWQSIPSPFTFLPTSAVTCASTTTCLAVTSYSDDVYRTTNSGDSWTPVTVPPVTNVGFGAQEGNISCPTATTCYIVDPGDTNPQSGVLIESTDAGASWTNVPLPFNDAEYAVSCPTVQACYAVGSDELVTDVGPVTSATATLSSPLVDSTTNLETAFTTSAIGSLGPGATITLQVPDHSSQDATVFPSDASSYVVTDDTGASDEVGSVLFVVPGETNEVTLVLSRAGITDSDTVTILVSGMTNETQASTNWELGISTSADLSPAATSPITLNPGPVVLSPGEIQVHWTIEPPDGPAPIYVDVSLFDSYGNTVPGRTVTLTQGSTHAVITPASAVTNSSGPTVFTVTDATSEVVTLSATDVSDNLFVGDTMVEFAVTIPTFTTLSPSENPSPAGQPFTLTATIEPAPNGGAVTFIYGGAVIAGCGDEPVDGLGEASCTVGLLPGEVESPSTIGADYSDIPPVGSTDYGSSTATLEEYFGPPSSGTPTVTTEPQNITVDAGRPATFTSTATGDPPPSVQWEVSTDGGDTYTDLPHATSTTYSTVASDADNANKYRAAFTSSTGTTTSTAATLTVNDAVLVTTTSLPDATAGVAFSSQLEAINGATQVYRWRKIKGSLPKGVTLKTDGLLSGTPTRSASHPYSFTVSAASGTPGERSAATQRLSLTVLP